MTPGQAVRIVATDSGFRIALLDDAREISAQPQNNFNCADIPAVVAWIEANLGANP